MKMWIYSSIIFLLTLPILMLLGAPTTDMYWDSLNVTFASKAEIKNITKKMWDKDTRITKHLVLNYQCKTTTEKLKDDCAPYRLFNDSDLSNICIKPSYQAFVKLFDNYEPSTLVNETVTEEEIKEENIFLDMVLDSDVMQLAWGFLKEKNSAPKDRHQFKIFLRTLWFDMYERRKNVLGSCGFEHVFLGEASGTKVLGFHNWLWFYLLEENRLVNYKGYIYTLQPHLAGLRFDWNGNSKPLSSFFLGTSPEYEFSIYTLCYLVRKDKSCAIYSDKGLIRIDSFTMKSKHIGAIFPLLP